MGNPPLWYEHVWFTVYDSSCKDQSAILPTSTSRTSPITKTSRGHASHASPTHIKINQLTHQSIRHSTFQLSSNRLKMTVLPCSPFCVRHHDPFFARRPSPSSSASRGDPRSTHFRMYPLPPPLPQQPHHHRPSPSRIATLKFLRHPRPPRSAAASSLHRCMAAPAPAHTRARSGVPALLRAVVPYPIARRCGS